MRQFVGILAAGVLAVALFSHPAGAQLVDIPELGYDPDAFPVVKPIQGTGVIDMEQRTVRVVAWGTCDTVEAASDADCLATAYAVARRNGLQQLGEIVGQLEVGSGYDSNGINKGVDEVVVDLEAFVRGAVEVPGVAPNDIPYRGFKYMPDGSIVAWTTLEMPLKNAVLDSMLINPEVRSILDHRMKIRAEELKNRYIEAPPGPSPMEEEVQTPPENYPEMAGPQLPPEEPTPETEESDVESPEPAPLDPFSGLILNGSGFPNQPTVIAPTILSVSGERVYDMNRVNRSVKLNGEIVRYCPSIEKAKTYRDKVGGNPLVISALDLHRDGIMVVSDDDAQRVAAADEQGKFLRFGRVIVVY